MGGKDRLSQKQREYILERDSYRCQMRIYNPNTKRWEQCKNTLHLEVHHILPQRWMDKFLPNREKHSPHNLITLCRDHCHSGPTGIHPDIYQAKQEYRYNKESFNKVFKERDRKVERGEVYWQTEQDWQLYRTAKRNTSKFRRKFPKD